MTRQSRTWGLLSSTVLFAVAGCNIVPIQAARIAQMESYRHQYRLQHYREDQAVRIFEQLLGEENRCNVHRSEAEWKPFLSAAVDGELEAVGQLTMTISLYPWDKRKFFVEGQGNYIVRSLHDDKDRLIASADFRIVDGAARPIEALRKSVDILIRQYVVRQFFDGNRYVHESHLIARIKLVPLPDKKVYTIDYGAWHEVAIGVRQGNVIEAVPAGCLRFDGGGDGRKLVDFRDHDSMSLRDDYGSELEKRKYLQSSDELSVEWPETLPALCGDVPPNAENLATLRTRADAILPPRIRCPTQGTIDATKD